MSDRIEKFEIRIDDEILDDLKTRLARTRWTAGLKPFLAAHGRL